MTLWPAGNPCWPCWTGFCAAGNPAIAIVPPCAGGAGGGPCPPGAGAGVRMKYCGCCGCGPAGTAIMVCCCACQLAGCSWAPPATTICCCGWPCQGLVCQLGTLCHWPPVNCGCGCMACGEQKHKIVSLGTGGVSSLRSTSHKTDSSKLRWLRGQPHGMYQIWESLKVVSVEVNGRAPLPSAETL